MIEEILPIHKGQYMTDIMPEGMIPSNSIIDKALPGLGITYCEIKARRDSILIVPNLPILFGKCEAEEHRDDNLMGVTGDTQMDELNTYIETTLDTRRYLKFVTTPESFPKVESAMKNSGMDIRTQCFLLFDECQKMVKECDWRGKITLPIDTFFQCEQKAMVSATPLLPNDPRFEEQGFQLVHIRPDYPCNQPLDLCITDNITLSLQHICSNLAQDDVPIFIFLNSIDLIYHYILAMETLWESSIFCSELSAKKRNAENWKDMENPQICHDKWSVTDMTRYNWMTSRYYTGFDIKLEQKPHVIMVSNCQQDYTLIDPFTDARQIAGRFRNGTLSIHHITNVDVDMGSVTRAEAEEQVKIHRDIYNLIYTLYNTASTSVSRMTYKSVLDILPYREMLNEQGIENHFSIEHWIHHRLVQSAYCMPVALVDGYTSQTTFTVNCREEAYHEEDELNRRDLPFEPKWKQRQRIVEWLEAHDPMETDDDYEEYELMRQLDPFIVKAYEVIGPQEIKRLGYNYRKIQRAVILQQFRSQARGDEVTRMVYNEFEDGKYYPDIEIQGILNGIFHEMNIEPPCKVTGANITDYYNTTRLKIHGTRGYRIISRKVNFR